MNGSSLAFREVTLLQFRLLVDAPDSSLHLLIVPYLLPEGFEVVLELPRTLHILKKIGWCMTHFRNVHQKCSDFNFDDLRTGL